MSRRAIPVLLVVMALAVAACGESAEDEALAEVCDARASIQGQIEELEGLRPTPATDDEVRLALDTIRADVAEITDASDALAEDTRQDVETATEDFLTDLDDALLVTVAGTGSTEPGQLERAIDTVTRSYEETLASIDCE